MADPLIPLTPPSKSRRRGRFFLVSLGCPKNLVDSEQMVGLLHAAGYRLTDKLKNADFAVVNTCGFVADARHESHQAIGEMLQRKRQGQLRGVIVAGCLAERDREALLREHPEIDQIVGVFARDDIATAADRLFDPLAEHRATFRPAPARALADDHRVRITSPHLAFLKISEGCDRLCSFCSIPSMRGPYASKPIEQIVDEARLLAADGARELVLVAQDTSFYGLDLYGRPRLAELLSRLSEIDSLAWIRVMYLYPQYIDDELIRLFAAGGKLLPYLDLPLQHIDDDVLERMSRRVTRAETESLIDRLRDGIPGLVLRTTMLVGFPGETDTQFESLVEFVATRRFERLGAFAFCPEPGTPAADLPDQVPEEVRIARRDRLLAVQQPIAFAWGRGQVGRMLSVILDKPLPDQPGVFLGRSHADAPEIDGAVYVTGERLAPGQIVPCEIVAAEGYDLVGVRLEA